MSRYSTKRTVLRPLTAWRRRRSGELDPYSRAVFEAHDYRPAIRRFFEATIAQPDILIDVDLRGDAVILDVGAYEGEYSRRILDRADAQDHGASGLRIHAFEPGPHSVRLLHAAFAREPRIAVHPFGLGGRDRVERMSLGGPGSSIFVPPDTPGWFGQTDIELRDVDGVLEDLGVDRVELLKVNIEGGEYELLDRLYETGRLARCTTVIVQFHEFAPDAYRARRRNRRQLAETHRRAWSYDWVFERWDRHSRTRGSST